MSLPTEKTEITADLELMTWLLYGPAGIGKSTFLADIDDVLFLTTEHAHRHLSIFKRPIKDWEDFTQVVGVELEKPQASQFSKICVDTVFNLFMMCQAYVCDRDGMIHPNDEGYGKGWDAVTTEFRIWITALAFLNKGLFFICHEKHVEIVGRGVKFPKTVPRLAAKCWEVLSPLVDVIAYAGFDPESENKSRVLITQPRENLEAKFRTPEGQESPLPAVLPLNYEAVRRAWLNRNKTAQPTKGVFRHAKAQTSSAPLKPIPTSTGPRRIVG